MSLAANLTAGESAVIASGLLWQYDRGQTLAFSGVELPPAFRADFCNAGDAETKSMTGTDGAVVIPDEFLLDGRPVICFVVVPDLENERETKYKIIMPVVARPEPTDLSPSPSEEQYIDSLVAAINAAVDAAEIAKEGAEAARDAALEAQTGAESAKADADEAADRAESAVRDADSYAQDASHYAYLAAGSARDADQSAGAADRSAGAAAGYAQDAQNAADDAEAAKQTILGMSAAAETLPAGSQATANYDNGLLTIGVPRGEKGEKGDKGDKGEPGESATDYETLNNLPQINGITLKGNTILDAEDIGALPDSYTPPTEVFRAVYDTTTSEEIETAYQSGKICVVDYGGHIYWLVRRASATNHIFSYVYTNGYIYLVSCISNIWVNVSQQMVRSVNGQTGAVSLTIPSSAADVGAIAAPSSPATGAFLVWDGSAWTAQTLAVWQAGAY